MTKPKKSRINKPRNLGTMSEAAYWSKVRSTLRRAFQYWQPAKACKDRSKKRVHNPANPRQRFAYECAHCNNWFMDKEVQVDHIIPVGTLLGPDDLAPFLERLCPENPEAFQVLCKPCHQTKTNSERPRKKI